MKTVGEILRKARLEKHLDLELVEKDLRIRKKFLQAIEDNSWNKLPSLPYIKGFLRNYSRYLDLKPEEMVAIFRRQFRDQDKEGILPKGLTSPLNDPIIRLTPQIVVGIVTLSLLLLLFGYLFFQYRLFTSPPPLTILQPEEGKIVTTEKVDVEGQTDSDAVVSINNQKVVVSADGKFHLQIPLSPGINTIIIESTSKHGKKKTITRTIQLQNP
ncbi:helix-turn-helix domain-containing protein [Candidatus Gottesmanbacteria bacterium]|nr:helix-turn-helix domain-containing protein [Candidatus Gottesmanbacteria bacterium]